MAHLLARHGIQGKAGRHFGDSAASLGDDHKIDNDQDDEDDEPHQEIAAHHEIAERPDHLPGGRAALVAVEKDQAGGGDVQGEPEQGGDQQDGGEGGKFQGLGNIDGGQ